MVLGPLLFLAFINDLPESTKHSDARLFADDCLLYRHISSSEDSPLLQQDLSTLARWEEPGRWKFHPEKCTVIRISTDRRRIMNTNYQIHGHSLEVVDNNKYLGVTISEDFTWRKKKKKKKKKKHVENTAKKTLGFVWRNLSDCTAPVKSAAYTTMVRPVLEYSYTVWDSHLARDTHALEQVQRRAARFVHRHYSERTPGCVTNMVQSLGWESLKYGRFVDWLSMLFKIQRGLVDVNAEFVQLNDSRTKGSQRLRQLQATADIYKYSFYPRTICDWNRLSPELQGFRDGLAHLPFSLRPHYWIHSSLYI